MRFLFIVLLALALPLSAHDFWLEPSSFRPASGDDVAVSIRVGEHFRGESVTRRAFRIESFVVRDGGGDQAVNGIEGGDPAGVVTIDDAGVIVIGYEGKATPHRLPAAKFNEYLHEEGLDDLQATSEATQREHFYRVAKTMLRSGADAGAKIPPPFGYRLEFQPLGDPFAAEPLELLLLLDGKPLEGALVTAMHRDGKQRLTAHTDSAGKVTLDLGRGVWLLKNTQVIPADGADRDWDSYWASLTLER